MNPSLFHISLYGAALVMFVTTLFFTFLHQRTVKLNNKMFIIIVSVLGVNALTEMIFEYVMPLRFESDSMFFVLEMCMYFYFLLHAAVSPLILVYVNTVSGAYAKYSKIKRMLFSIPFLITEAFLIANPINHWYFSFDEKRQFQRGWAESSLYLSALFYLVFSLYTLIYTWRALTIKRRVAIAYFFTVALTGIAIQFVNIDLKVELFAEAVGLMGIMLSVESEDDRIDIDTGFYNRRALQLDLNNYIVNKRELWLICIKVTNADIIPRVTGSENVDILSTLMSDYLKTKVPRTYIYNMNPETFMITLPDRREKDIAELAEDIIKRFEEPWTINENEYLLKAVLMYADVPKRVPSSGDAFYMADSPVPESNDKKILSGNDLNYLLRRSAIQNAIVNGLKKESFEVYYQPTFNLSDGSLHGAEALLRLDDPFIGKIPPYEFIPISEQMGLVDVLDNYVLSEVCKLLTNELKDVACVEAINVNLSVLQCMKPDFIENINGEANKYGVDRNRINFEITESVAASDYDQLAKIVAELKSSGFRFSLDDYGTGYSNVMSVFSMDLDIIKIDKSILWSAIDNKLGRILLENTVSMIKQMGRKILVEGIETQEHIDLLREVGVDYLQGFYLAKPMPKDEYLALIQGEINKKQKEKI